MAGEDSSRTIGREAKQETSCYPTSRAARDFAEGDCDARLIDIKFSRCDGQAGRISAASSGVRTRRQGLLSVWNDHPASHCGWAKQLFLSEVPACTGGQRRVAASQTCVEGIEEYGEKAATGRQNKETELTRDTRAVVYISSYFKCD